VLWLSFAAPLVGAFLLRPGVVVDPGSGVLYAMRPGGGLDAIEIASGHTRWHTSEAAMPLAASGDLIVALADHGASASFLDVVLLSARDGRKQGAARVALPSGVWSSIDDGPGQSLSVTAEVEGSGVVVVWTARQTPTTGVAPGEAELPMRTTRGAARIDPASARVEPLPADGLLVGGPGEAQLPKVAGAQSLSVDGRHMLASERIADDSVWEKYRWTIYALPGAKRLGELHSPFPQAPFFVTGTLLVFESRPFERRIDGTLVQRPLALRAVDLAAGAEVWTAPLRDTTFSGPFPEGREGPM
jgi:hypothetical protein